MHNDNNGKQIGYANNATYQTGKVSATVILDPPTGNYYTWGTFYIPYYCIYHNWWTTAVTNRTTGAMSYVN